MRQLLPMVGEALLVGGGSALASTHSDFTKSFPLQTLKTFEFKDQRRIPRDPLANNATWANDVKDAIRSNLTEHGIVEATSGNPDFFVSFYVGLSDRYDMHYVIDAHTNQLVWRGHDVDTLNTDHPDKTLSKAVDNVIERFAKDAKQSGHAA